MFVEVASAMQEAVTRVLNVERNHEHVLQNPSCKLNNELHCILSTQPEPGTFLHLACCCWTHCRFSASTLLDLQPCMSSESSLMLMTKKYL